ncbi:MAG: PAS domain S-box protein [Anaerolineae bacterium]
MTDDDGKGQDCQRPAAEARLAQDAETVHQQSADPSAALLESEARFRGAFEYAAIGMALVGPQGRFLQVNRSLCKMFGYSEDELLGKTFQELTHPDDLDVGLGLFDDLMSRKRDYGWLEKRYLHRNGRAIWAQLSTAVVRDEAGCPLYLVSEIQDITERKQAEEELAEREAQYRAIFEGTGDGLFIVSLDGRIVEINPAACEMYGFRREEAVGQPLTTLITMDYHTLFHEMLRRIEQGEEFVTQAVDRRRDGTPFHVEVHGSSFTYAGSLHMLSVVRDITDRVRSVRILEQRVQQRTRELSTLLQVSRDVASTLQLEPLLAKILDLLLEVVSYDAAAIFALEGEDHLILLDYRGPRPRSGLPRRWELSQVEHIRMVLDHRQPLAIPDVHAKTPRAEAWQQSWGSSMDALAENTASWLGVPLMVRDRLIGTLTLEHREVGHFTPLHAKLALAFANQAAVALENARLYEESQRLGMLEERHRIARELHDSVSQALYGITLGARTAGAVVTRDPDKALESIEYILNLAEAGLADMRALLLELRPYALQREGLVVALNKQIEALRRRYDLEISTSFGKEPETPAPVKEALYRVAHEALSNTVKHANAHEVQLSLADQAGTLILSVWDDGDGFDADRVYPGHYGLQSMRERIERLGGTLTITSAHGAGTLVRAVIPPQEQ